jgi:hypothetical protein
MNETIVKLFTELKGGQLEAQKEAALYLALLAEKNGPTTRNDDVFAVVLPPDLSGLKLSPWSLAELMAEARKSLRKLEVPTIACISLVTMLGKAGHLEDVRAIIEFIKERFRTFSAEETRATLVALQPQRLLKDELVSAKEVFDQEFIEVLDGLALTGPEGVTLAVERLKNRLKQLQLDGFT